MSHRVLPPSITRDPDAWRDCPDCGLLQRLPRARDGALVTCVRCNALLLQVRSFTIPLATVCAGLGLSLLAFANLFPLASVTAPGGKTVTADVAGSVTRLEETGTWELLIPVALTLLVIPALKLGVVVGMAIGVSTGRAPRWLKFGFTEMPWLTNWAMVDVFMLGAMVALFRMRSQGHVSFEPAMFALGGFALCSLAMDAALDPREFWRRLPLERAPGAEAAVASGPLIACHHCGLVDSGRPSEPCPRCERKLHHRRGDSLTRTWSLVVTAFLLLIPANVLPVMTVTTLRTGGPSTIWHGVLELMDVNLYGLAFIVFVASVVVPVAKLVALCVLLVMTQRGSAAGLKARTRIYRAVAVIGRWSMLDIFATMTLVALARFGALGQVMPEVGASAFCAVVFVTMVAAEQFDPRIMWDAAGQNAHTNPLEPPEPSPREGATA